MRTMSGGGKDACATAHRVTALPPVTQVPTPPGSTASTASDHPPAPAPPGLPSRSSSQSPSHSWASPFPAHKCKRRRPPPRMRGASLPWRPNPCRSHPGRRPRPAWPAAPPAAAAAPCAAPGPPRGRCRCRRTASAAPTPAAWPVRRGGRPRGEGGFTFMIGLERSEGGCKDVWKRGTGWGVGGQGRQQRRARNRGRGDCGA